MKLLLTGIAALFLASTAAYAADEELPPEAPPPPPSIRVNPAPAPVPPLGWVYGYYAPCADPGCRTVVVNVDAAGLNVRTVPNGYPTMSLGEWHGAYSITACRELVTRCASVRLNPDMGMVVDNGSAAQPMLGVFLMKKTLKNRRE